MIPNIRNGPPAHLSDAEIANIRKAVYKILVERCDIEEVDTAHNKASVLNFNDMLLNIIANSIPEYN